MDQPISKSELKRRWRKRIWSSGILLSAILAIVWVLKFSLVKSVHRDDIRVAPVQLMDLKGDISAGGTVVPLVEETLTSPFETNIRQVFVQAGQRVSPGQSVMQLDTRQSQLELEKLEEELALKDNQVQSRKLQLSKAINSLHGQLELLQVELESRKTRLNRLEQLSEIGGTSAEDLHEGQLNVRRTEIQIRQLHQSIEDQKASTDAEIRGLELERSILNRSRMDLKRQIEQATVTSNMEGLVSWLKSEEGSSVQKGESLVRISDSNAVKIEATLSDFYANQIWQGMGVESSVEGQVIHGVLESIVASEQAGVLKLTIHLGPSQVSLRLKQRLEVQLITGEVKDALAIRKGPFINGSGRQEVFVLEGDSARKRIVDIGTSNHRYFEVLDGLQEGEQVIISSVRTFAHVNKLKVKK